MHNRNSRQLIAKETLEIVANGGYTFGNKKVTFKDEIESSVANTKTYSETEIESLMGGKLSDNVFDTKVVVTKNSVVDDIINFQSDSESIAVLNFASARNPGGGFQNGSMSQEEAICYASALYETLKDQQTFYKNPKHFNSGLYSNMMIYSPNVPIIRDSKGVLLSDVVLANFITSPAVNVKDLKFKKKSELLKLVDTTMESRIEGIIALAKDKKIETLILGAFGCGVFENNPYKVKDAFVKVLNKPEYKKAFKTVVFSIYEHPKDNNKLFNIFKQIQIRK